MKIKQREKGKENRKIAKGKRNKKEKYKYEPKKQ